MLLALFFVIVFRVKGNANGNCPVLKANQSVNVSWYGSPNGDWGGVNYNGRKMANGKVFHWYDSIIVAHKCLPFGTKVTLFNKANNTIRTFIVQDRGPYIKGREFDLSLKGAQIMGFASLGVAQLKILKIEKPKKIR